MTFFCGFSFLFFFLFGEIEGLLVLRVIPGGPAEPDLLLVERFA